MQGKRRPSIVLGLSLVLVASLSGSLLAGPAAAAVPGKNGEIRACYKVRGKGKGSMRVVAGKRCRRGERKLAWTVTGPAGSQGASAAPGSPGSSGAPGGSSAGAPGSSGSTETTAALETKVAALTLKVETLEDTLTGVANGDLTGAIGKLSGVTGPQLTDTVGKLSGVTGPQLTDTVGKLSGVTGPQLTDTVGKLSGVTGPELNEAVGKLSGVTGLQLNEAVGAVPVVSSLCTQANALPTQINDSLDDALSGLSLGGTIPPLLKLTVPTLTEVPAFTCPS